MNKLLIITLLALLPACSGPRDEAYCNTFNLPKASSEYAACKTYFAKMDKWFSDDLSACSAKADISYPQYLYDHARYGQEQTIDRFGILRTSTILIEPDYARNAELDKQRRAIIAPCMIGKKWKSPDNWQAGRVGDEPSASQF